MRLPESRDRSPFLPQNIKIENTFAAKISSQSLVKDRVRGVGDAPQSIFICIKTTKQIIFPHFYKQYEFQRNFIHK
jgi:hypothetical protein